MSFNKRNFLLAISVLLLLVIVACNNDEEQEAIEDAVDGEVVATVNGESIYGEELNLMVNNQMIMYGMDPEDEENAQVVEQMRALAIEELIIRRLLLQEGAAHDLEPTEEEVEVELEVVKSGIPEELTYEEALEMQGYTEEMLKDEIREVLTRNSVLELNHLAESDYAVSEDEKLESYEVQVEQGTEDREFEEAEEDITHMLRQRKYIEDLEEKAEIEILI